MEKLKEVEIAKVRGLASAATEKTTAAYARNSFSKAPFHAGENPGPDKKLQQVDG